MNEQDLNEGLRDVMQHSTPPPSMDPSQALGFGRAARRRRRIAWSALAVVPLVAVVGAGPTLATHLRSDGPVDGLPVAGTTASQPTATPSQLAGDPTAQSSKPPTVSKPRKSGDPWPEGQTDRTASAGPRVERVSKLRDDLIDVVPDGFTTPDLKAPEGYKLRLVQAQYASNDGEPDYWEYAVMLPVVKDGKVGELVLNSTTNNGKPGAEPCKLSGGKGSCQVIDVGGKKVGVMTSKGEGDYDQWAAYRYDDGTVVRLSQAKKNERSGKPALRQPVFTSRQLAELVTSAPFKVSE